MDSNTHSVRPVASLAALAAVVNDLAAQDLDGLADAVRAERVLVLRRLVDRLEGQWLNELAGVDARGAAGAEDGIAVGSTAGGPGALGGDIDTGPLDPEACRRLACDGTLTRGLVTRHPTNPHSHGHHDPGGHHRQGDPGGGRGLAAPGPGAGGNEDLASRLRAAMTLLPPVLGGAPSQPLEVGRSSRVVQAAQRAALAVRDGGGVFPGCQRPLAWCEAHHLRHWLHGGPTDLSNLALVCRAHHRAVHEGGWQLARAPDGRLTAPHPTDHSKDTRPPPDRRTNADHQTGGEPGRGCAEERSSSDPTTVPGTCMAPGPRPSGTATGGCAGSQRKMERWIWRPVGLSMYRRAILPIWTRSWVSTPPAGP